MAFSLDPRKWNEYKPDKNLTKSTKAYKPHIQATEHTRVAWSRDTSMRAEGTTPDDFGIGLRVGQVSWENGQVAHIVLVGDEHKAESIDFLTNMCSEQLKACQGSRFVIVDTANPIKP